MKEWVPPRFQSRKMPTLALKMYCNHLMKSITIK